MTDMKFIFIFAILILVNYSQSTQPPDLKTSNNTNVTRDFLSDFIQTVGSDVIRSYLFGYQDVNVTKYLVEKLEQFKTDDATECVVDTFASLFALLRLDYWAIQLIDAQGKLRSGLTDGNLVWPGSFTVCKEVIQGPPFSPQFKRPFRGRYCWAQVLVDTSWIQLPIKNLPVPTLKWGLCVPDTCTSQEIFGFLKTITDFKVITNFANVTDVSCLPDKTDFWHDRKAVIAFVICIIFGVIILLATTYDVFLKYHRIRYRRLTANESPPDGNIIFATNGLEHNDTKEQIPEAMDEDDNEDLCQKIILAFSIRRNFYKLLSFDKSKTNIDCLNGIRVLSMMWLILSETYITGSLLADNLLTVVNVLLSLLFEFVALGVLAIDTFFLLSGLLVSYQYFLHHEQNNEKISWIKFYLYRYIRLTPFYILFILVIDGSLINYFGDGPFWPSNGFEGNNCEKNWWWNLLYINNFTPSKYGCLEQSWYLATDMQFYIISPLILILLSRFLPFGLVISGVFILISWLTSGFVSAHYKIKADLDVLKYQPKTDQYYEVLDRFYYKPYLHIAPYVIGMLCGWMLHRTKFQQKLKVWMVFLGWILTAGVGLTLLLGLYKANDRISAQVAALYHALSRTAWSLVLCWIIFACSNGYGGIVNFILSLPVWKPFGRLTYCAFLLYLLVINVVFDSSNVPVHFSHLFMLFYSAANIFVIYTASIVISLVFEVPFLELLKISPKYTARSNIEL